MPVMRHDNFTDKTADVTLKPLDDRIVVTESGIHAPADVARRSRTLAVALRTSPVDFERYALHDSTSERAVR